MNNIIDFTNQGKATDRLQKIRDAVEVQVAEEKAEFLQDKWEKAKELFPKTSFPWQVLPSKLSDSFKQLARSHATSSTAIPNAAMAILSSVIGSTVKISVKQSWSEPLIFWFVDIRNSGEGKTPAARALCKPLYKEQQNANTLYEKRLQLYKQENCKGEMPKKARGYFITDLTLEGIRNDLSGHGGTVCILDELSAFISSQNQYKSKGGSDREAWLSLYDGDMSRSVRAEKSITIDKARVNIFGGIQPDIWIRFFGGDKKLYLSDGTIFRFLPVYEGEQFYPLTAESWSDENRETWESTLKNAMTWADEWITIENGKSVDLCLNEAAQELFLDWGNEFKESKSDFPNELKGFIPKIIGSALRLTGILYCMDCFSENRQPTRILKEDVQKGIDTAKFFMGHIVNSIETLMTGKKIEIEMSENAINLREILNTLRTEVDNGKLAIGYVAEKFNKKFSNNKISSRAMGSFMRSCGLTTTETHYRANGKAGVCCLIWDQKTDSFLKTMSTMSTSPQNLK